MEVYLKAYLIVGKSNLLEKKSLKRDIWLF